MHNVDRSYEEGYNNGLNWPDDWEMQDLMPPGGPFVCRGQDYERMKAENAAWRTGWAAGHLSKQTNKRSNPLNTPQSNARYHDKLLLQKYYK